jgi:hypothetical protein
MIGKFKTWLSEFLYGKEEEPVKTPTVCNCDCNGNCVCSCGCNGDCQCKKTVILPVQKVEIPQAEIKIPVRDAAQTDFSILGVEEIRFYPERKPLPKIVPAAKKPFSTKEAAKNKTGNKSAIKRPKKK